MNIYYKYIGISIRNIYFSIMINDTLLRSDMLSTKKIKLHGMSEPRWTTRDKITQYKGLIKLYRRDKKIMLADKQTTYKLDKHHLCTLMKKNVMASREKLESIIFGDRQSIRNALGDDRCLQLAYQDLHPEEIMEHIYQENFRCKKELDLIYYKMREKTITLVRLKLRVSELEDRCKYDSPGSFPIEVQCRVLTGDVQNGILTYEAAIVVHEAYKRIIEVCKKDASYFDSMLESLWTDHARQGKCMLNSIILGQMAIEYLDDRRVQFKSLEKSIKRYMQYWRKDVNELSDMVDAANKNTKKLIRRDSDVTLPLRDIDTNVSIQREIHSICDKMDILKSTFYVNKYSELLDCLQNQFYQKNRLEEIRGKWRSNLEGLYHKRQHARAAYDQLHNTMVNTTNEYVATKTSIKKQILEVTTRINVRSYLNQKKCELIARIKTTLQNLEQTCKYIKEPGHGRGGDISFRIPVNESMYNTMLVNDLVDIKPTCQEILKVLEPKLILLNKQALPILTALERETARTRMESLASARSNTTLYEVEHITAGLLEDCFYVEDPSVPTRAEIKKQSKQVVLENTVNEDLVPVFDIKPRRKKKWT